MKKLDEDEIDRCPWCKRILDKRDRCKKCHRVFSISVMLKEFFYKPNDHAIPVHHIWTGRRQRHAGVS